MTMHRPNRDKLPKCTSITKLVLVFLSTIVSSSALGCDSAGAFGLEFGSKPERPVKTLRQNNASITYVVVAPKPDSRFDEYRVRVDTKSGEIFEALAVKRITKPPAIDEPGLSKEDQERAIQDAQAFAKLYIETLSQESRAVLSDEYGIGSWKGMISDSVKVHIIASSPWEVTVGCEDLRREGAILKRAW